MGIGKEATVMPENEQQRDTSRRRWIAPRTGGYRPGGEFSHSEGSRASSTPTVTPPEGSGGVVPANRN